VDDRDERHARIHDTCHAIAPNDLGLTVSREQSPVHLGTEIAEVSPLATYSWERIPRALSVMWVSAASIRSFEEAGTLSRPA
jgi:hypothetical protein